MNGSTAACTRQPAIAPSTAFPLGAKLDDPLAMYAQDLATIPANLAGTPGISIPAGVSDVDGLPVGVQLLAPVLEDARLYRVGAALEGAVGQVLSIDKLEVAR